MLYRAIADGNWKRPLDFTLHSSHQGEFRIPFSSHVRRLKCATPEACFPLFEKLPAELQLAIFRSCDPATVFQLMHTSHFTRNEAKKLFFSDLETWYYMDANWLLSGGEPGRTKHDLNFLASIERLEVDFGFMHEMTWLNDEGTDEWTGAEDQAVSTGFGGMAERIQEFWQTVENRLPRLKHIILSDDHDRSESAELDLLPEIHREVGQMCPSGIDVFIYLLEGDGTLNRRMTRRLWQRVNSTEVTNNKKKPEGWDICTKLLRPSVIPPYKVFRGPAGIFEDANARVTDVSHQRKAIKIQRIAAMERYHFYGSHQSFGCSEPDCHAWFKQPEEYTSHVIETKHDQFSKLPDHIECLFTENEKRLERLMNVANEADQSIVEWWGEYRSEERRKAEEELIYQLEHDPLYAQDGPIKEHPVLYAIRRSIDGRGL